MKAMQGWICAAAVASQVAVAPAAAQDARPESLRRYGGTYSSDCGDPAAAKVRIGADALVIEHGPRRTVGRGVMDSYTSFGGAPTSPVPEGYVMEFISDAFSLYVFEDKAGYYIDVGGDVPAAEAVIGKASMRIRFRRCDARAGGGQRSGEAAVPARPARARARQGSPSGGAAGVVGRPPSTAV